MEFLIGALSAMVAVLLAGGVWALRMSLANAEHIRNVDAKTAASFHHIGMHLREVSEKVDELDQDLGYVEAQIDGDAPGKVVH